MLPKINKISFYFLFKDFLYHKTQNSIDYVD